MIARAIHAKERVAAEPARKKRKARWNIDATLRDAGLRQMLMIVADKKSSHAAVCKASALLLRAEAQNQKDEQRKKKKKTPKKIPVVHLRWNGKEPKAEGETLSVDGEKKTEVRDQKSECVGVSRRKVANERVVREKA